MQHTILAYHLPATNTLLPQSPLRGAPASFWPGSCRPRTLSSKQAREPEGARSQRSTATSLAPASKSKTKGPVTMMDIAGLGHLTPDGARPGVRCPRPPLYRRVVLTNPEVIWHRCRPRSQSAAFSLVRPDRLGVEQSRDDVHAGGLAAEFRPASCLDCHSRGGFSSRGSSCSQSPGPAAPSGTPTCNRPT